MKKEEGEKKLPFLEEKRKEGRRGEGKGPRPSPFRFPFLRGDDKEERRDGNGSSTPLQMICYQPNPSKAVWEGGLMPKRYEGRKSKY